MRLTMPKPLTGWKRVVAIIVATAPIGIALFSFAFMARSERAFDESRCPYELVELREVEPEAREEEEESEAEEAELPPIFVREDAHTCEEGVEEHRWVLIREGEPEVPMGLRRLEAHLYEGYSWTASIEGGRVGISISNPGQEHPRVFREAAPDAGVAH